MMSAVGREAIHGDNVAAKGKLAYYHEQC